MRVTLLHNATAGDDPASADELVGDLRWAGYDVQYVPVGSGQIDLPAEPGEMLVVAGGDSTVCRVVKRVAGTGVPLAIVPVGTANNLARSLGQVGPVRSLAAGWRDGCRAALDVGRVSGPGGEDQFVEACGAGAFAGMIAAGEGRRRLDRGGFAGNRLDRGLQMMREAILAEPCQSRRLCVDGEEIERELLLVEVMNVRHLGSSVPFAPAADPTDGWFDLILATEDDRAAIVAYLDQRLHGFTTRALPLTVRRCRRLSMAPGDGHVHLDDHVWTMIEEREHHRSFEITLDRGAIEVVLGAAPPPRFTEADDALALSRARRDP